MEFERFRKPGAKVTAAIYGEALFAPGTDLSNWKRRFSNRLTAKTRAAAPLGGPTGKYPQRTLRPHPGKRLKSSFSSGTQTRITKGGGRFYIGVSSSSSYAIYVDQGTGVFAGHSAYEAKILPPFNEGGDSLYEATFRPGGPGTKKLAKVMIQGQPGQHFFDKGLAEAMRSMHLRSAQLPGEGVSGIASALGAIPENLFGSGATPSDPGFQKRLEEWRDWRDRAFNLRWAATPSKPNPNHKPVKRTGTREHNAALGYASTGKARDKRRKQQVRDIARKNVRREIAAKNAAKAEKAKELQWKKNLLAAKIRTSNAETKARANTFAKERDGNLYSRKNANGTMTYIVRYFGTDGKVYDRTFNSAAPAVPTGVVHSWKSLRKS